MRKYLALVLALVMCLTLFSACGKSEQAPIEATGEKTPVAESNTPVTETPSNSAEELPELWMFSNYGRLAAEGSAGSIPESLAAVQDYIAEQTGVKLNAIVAPLGSETEKLNLRLASGEPLDFFAGDWRDYYADGVIMELTDYLTEEKMPNTVKAMDEMDPNWRSVVTDTEGRIWAIPASTAYAGYPVYVRQDWLDQVGLPVPTTMDELETVLEAFAAEDFSGTGETIPMLTGETLKQVFHCFGGAFLGDGASGNWVSEDGKLMPKELHPGYKDFVAQIADWYAKGYIYKDNYQINRAKTAELIAQNKVGVMAAWYSYTTNPVQELWLNHPEANYVMAVIKGDNGDYAQVVNGPLYGSATLVSASCQNMDAFIAFTEWMFSDVSTILYTRNGLRGVSWDFADSSTDKFPVMYWLDQASYAGEFESHNTMWHTVAYATAKDGGIDPTSEYCFGEILDFSKVSYQGDYDTIYDVGRLNEECPNEGDLQRLWEEETLKFIMGSRSMDEWDNYIDQMYAAGVETWIEAYTAQYVEQAS